MLNFSLEAPPTDLALFNAWVKCHDDKTVSIGETVATTLTARIDVTVLINIVLHIVGYEIHKISFRDENSFEVAVGLGFEKDDVVFPQFGVQGHRLLKIFEI